MANDERRSEQFIREVDEELRRAQLKAIWDRFSPLIIGACVLVVALTAGYRGWLWCQEREAAAAGDRFLAALEQMDTDPAAGEAALQAIAEEEGAGYSVLARLRLAGAHAAAGETAEAIAAFDAIAADSSVSASLQSLASARAALLALDSGDLEGARERAEPLNVAGNVWRHVAREVLGAAAYASGDLEAARGYYLAIQEDAETPTELWLRAHWMTALIDGQLSPAGARQEPAAQADEAAAAGESETGDQGAALPPQPEQASAEEPPPGPGAETAPTPAGPAPTPPPAPPQPSPAPAPPSPAPEPQPVPTPAPLAPQPSGAAPATPNPPQ
jgi:hypothetical protein